MADDDVMPLVASSAGLPGFLGGGDPILPISLLYRSVYNLSTSKGWDIPFRGEGANDVFSCLCRNKFSLSLASLIFHTCLLIWELKFVDKRNVLLKFCMPYISFKNFKVLPDKS